NLAQIHAGLGNGDWSEGNMCDVSVEQPAGMRLYVNRGGTYGGGEFIKDTQGAVIQMSDVAHANLWFNFAGGWLDDINGDGLTDFVVMGLGKGTKPSALLSRGNGTFAVEDEIVQVNANALDWLGTY